MFVSAPRTLRRATPIAAAFSKKAVLALTALSMFTAPAAFACEDMSVPLGNGWTGMVDGYDGACAIYKEGGDGRSLSVYSDIDNRDGYWMLSRYEDAAPSSDEDLYQGPVSIEVFINGRSAGWVDAEASGDRGGEDWKGYQDFRINAGAMNAIVSGKPKGFKLEARLDGQTIFTIDARGAKKAFKDYGKCTAALPASWEALGEATYTS